MLIDMVIYQYPM